MAKIRALASHYLLVARLLLWLAVLAVLLVFYGCPFSRIPDELGYYWRRRFEHTKRTGSRAAEDGANT